MPRQALVKRETLETSIEVRLNLDGEGKTNIHSGIPFLDHMLDQVGRHGLFDLDIQAHGDLHIDAHHTVEDVGITLGQAFHQALADKHGVQRYGCAHVPLDEALSRVTIDLSGRPGLYHDIDYQRARIGDFDTDLIHEFLQGFVNHAQITIHVDGIKGRNAHHIAESVFKAIGRSLRQACEQDPRNLHHLPSTKGTL